MANQFARRAILFLAAISVSVLTSAQQGVLEEVIVTATRRAESLQDVPVSVAAINADSMRDFGITDMAQASAYLPNFEYSDSTILPNLYVRGIGSGTTHSIEQSVGRFVDDVYIGRAAINLHPFMDVQSVEVLRGPQGTLFGKNTLGGAVIINTGNPTDQLETGLEISQSSYSTVGGRTKLEGFASGPMGDNLRGRVAFFYRDQDGYVENLANGPDGANREDIGIRGKLEWDMGQNVTALLKLEHMEFENEGQFDGELLSGTFPGGPAAGMPIPEAFWQNFQPNFSYGRKWQQFSDCSFVLGPQNETFCPSRDHDTQNVTLKIDAELGDAGTLTSITGYQQYDYIHLFNAVDFGVAGSAGRFQREEEYEGITQEIRFTSNESDRSDYIVGMYFETSDLVRLQPSDFNIPSLFGRPGNLPCNSEIPTSPNFSPGPPCYTEREDWVQDTETIAVFGQLRYQFSDRLTGIIGGRWSSEDKDFSFELGEVDYQDDPSTSVIQAFALSRSESEFTPSFTLQWDKSDDVMLYASIAQGHKTGGFSDRLQSDPEFDAERNTTLELGAKGYWRDGSLQANFTLYYMDIEDLQVSRAIPGFGAATFEVGNAAEATSQGFEADGRWLLNNNWTIGGNLSYTDATYDNFPGASPSCPPVGGRLEMVGTEMLCNYAGMPLIFAPEWKGAAYMNYAGESVVGDWGLNATLALSFSSEWYGGLNYHPDTPQAGYGVIDASLRFSSPDDRYSVSLVGRNLTERYVQAWALETAFTRWAVPNAPRELAIAFSIRN